MADDNSNLFHKIIDYLVSQRTEAKNREICEIRLLDFGCGRGDLVRTLDNFGYSAYGCDVIKNWSFDDPKFKLIRQSPYRIPFEDESFDFILSTSVLEHAQNKEEVFREMYRVLKKGGGIASLSVQMVLAVRTSYLCPINEFFLA